MIFDATISLGNVLTIGSFLAVVIVYIVNGRAETKIIDEKLGVIDKRMDDFRQQIAAISKLLTEVAVQKQMIDTLGKQVLQLERWYDELRRGEGYILDIRKPASG